MAEGDAVVYTCLICQRAIRPQDGGLCSEHDTFAVLWAEVATGRCSDWEPNSGGFVNHSVMQISADCGEASRAWHVIVGDINRMARVWLDGRHGDDMPGGVAA